ncbi:hypothetical protein EAJ01_10755 [Bacteroides cellulosilyticus]|nr:hypothetical protein EAJ01_10755 [Bacteroides cellulosilyticus]
MRLRLEYPKNRTKRSAPYPVPIFFVPSSYLLRYFHPPIEAKQERTGYGSEEFLTKITHLIPPASRASLPDNFSVSNSFRRKNKKSFIFR